MARKKSQKKTIKPVFYVFCEGETEEKYVRFLKQYYRIPIQIDSSIKNNITDRYIKSYKRNRPAHEKDRTFIMYDLDKQDDKILKVKAEKLCSNPCIELWFLIHFKAQTATISTKNVINALKRKYPAYDKGVNDDTFFRKLISNNEIAITRSKKFIKYENPSSTVYKLVELLKKYTDN